MHVKELMQLKVDTTITLCLWLWVVFFSTRMKTSLLELMHKLYDSNVDLLFLLSMILLTSTPCVPQDVFN